MSGFRRTRLKERAVDALILGATPNSLSAARSLGRFGLKVAVAESKDVPSVRCSRYVSEFLILGDGDDGAVASRLIAYAAGLRNPFLFATGDRYALLVSRHQEQLRQAYCFVCPSYEVLERIVDKAKLYETARSLGFAVPEFSVVRSESDIEPGVATMRTPCYVKPALGHRWRALRRGKLVRAESPSELRRILRDFVSLRLVAVPQEIIPGGDDAVFSVAAYIDQAGRCRGWRTKRKIRQWPVLAGDGSMQEICDRPDVAELGLKLLAATGHCGPATVEFRCDSRDGRLVLIEINARTELGQDLITHSGLDLPLLAYCDAKGLPLLESGPPIPVRWVYFGPDSRAFRAGRRTGQITTLQWLMSVARCRSFAYLSLDDPKPFLVTVREWLANKLLQTSTRDSPGPGSPNAARDPSGSSAG